MDFKSIEIKGWKQFDSCEIEFHDRLTVLTGANGSGKTTLLHILANHFGWDFKELATPQKSTLTGAFSFIVSFFKKKEQPEEDNQFGYIEYSTGEKTPLAFPNDDKAKYSVNMPNMKKVPSLLILSHRSPFVYQEVPSVRTAKVSPTSAHNDYMKGIKQDNSALNYYKQSYANFRIKETLLSWAIGGDGNKYIEPDQDLKKWYEGFEHVLKKLIPINIGFQRLSIRNYEIVLATDSGDFMLDAVSGGLAAIVDLAWQIYTASLETKNIVVLIDEVENHLHPQMQRRILPDLLDAFPDIQFIVSTHSPLVVGSVRDSNTYALKYNKERRVYSIKLDLLDQARTASEILNEVLGVSFSMPMWAEVSFDRIISKYSKEPISEEMVDRMREELRAEGLENLMPLALTNCLDNDKD